MVRWSAGGIQHSYGWRSGHRKGGVRYQRTAWLRSEKSDRSRELKRLPEAKLVTVVAACSEGIALIHLPPPRASLPPFPPLRPILLPWRCCVLLALCRNFRSVDTASLQLHSLVGVCTDLPSKSELSNGIENAVLPSSTPASCLTLALCRLLPAIPSVVKQL